MQFASKKHMVGETIAVPPALNSLDSHPEEIILHGATFGLRRSDVSRRSGDLDNIAMTFKGFLALAGTK